MKTPLDHIVHPNTYYDVPPVFQKFKCMMICAPHFNTKINSCAPFLGQPHIIVGKNAKIQVAVQSGVHAISLG